VTAPFRAMALPQLMVAPVFNVTLASAIILPLSAQNTGQTDDARAQH
jgi:hypothetical protein